MPLGPNILDLDTLPFLLPPMGGGGGGRVSCFEPMRARTSCSSSKSACSRDIDGYLVFDRGFAASKGVMAAVDRGSTTETVVFLRFLFSYWSDDGQLPKK